MQYVKRQRLCASMEKLQTADHNDTVTKIARDCGYSHMSIFAVDFKQEFWRESLSRAQSNAECGGRKQLQR